MFIDFQFLQSEVRTVKKMLVWFDLFQSDIQVP